MNIFLGIVSVVLILGVPCLYIGAREVFMVLNDPHDIWEDEDENL